MAQSAALQPKKRRMIDMTQGNIAKHLITFALPLLAGNLFQQLYNAADAWVVGNFVSNEAFSAVGTVGPIINTLIGFFMGLASGAGVVISQYYGAREYEKVSKAVHTAIVLTFVMGIAMTAIGIGMTPTMLRFMKTPETVWPEAKAYLTVYFSGIIGLMFYNMGAGILRAVGDSRRPFYFLVVAALLNVALDLLLVIVFEMGVRGVAYATILSQGVSALLILIVLFRTSSCLRLHLPQMKMEPEMLRRILRVGMPAAVQMAITNFSNVFVQSYINHFGPDCMSGWTAHSKIDQIVLLPMQTLGLATTTFVGQNLGRGQLERAEQGAKTAWKITALLTAGLSLLVIWIAPWLVAVFNSKAEVVSYGTLFLRTLSPFYVICTVNQVYANALRGAGKSKIPMATMLIGFVFFRQLYLFVMANFISNTILPIIMGYPAGWVICSALTYYYYRKVGLRGSTLIEPVNAKPET